MSERLDRVEAILVQISESQNETSALLNRVAQQQARHTDEIDTLLGAVSANEVACRELRESTGELRESVGELRESTGELRESVGELRESTSELRESTREANQRFEILRAEAISDRQKWQAGFDRWQARSDQQNAQIMAMIEALGVNSQRISALERTDESRS